MTCRESARTSRHRRHFIFAVLLSLVAWPTSATGEHLTGDELREKGVEMEVEQLEIERDDARIQVDFQIQQSHWQRNHRAGLSIWIGLFTDRVEGKEDHWKLHHAQPIASANGSATFPASSHVRDHHVTVRFIAISNGRLLSPGHGLTADEHLHLAVDEHHGAPHSQSRFRHRTVHLSPVGSMHQFHWFRSARGFHRLHHRLEQQQLLNSAFLKHLRHHAHHQTPHLPSRDVAPHGSGDHGGHHLNGGHHSSGHH